MSLLLKYADPSLLVSVVRRVTEPVVTRWPATMFARFAGSLAYRDQQGQQTATGTGPIRYQPAPGTRVNLVKNPSFETNTAHWGANGLTIAASTDWAASGARSLQATVTAVAANTNIFLTPSAFDVRVVPGQVYTLAATVFNPNAGPRSVQLALIFRLLDNNVSGRVDTGYVTLAAGEVRRLTVTATAPATSQSFNVALYVTNDGPAPFQNGDLVYLDAVQVEEGSVATPYFDASTVPNAAWLDPITGQLGTPYQSPSVEQPVIWVEEGTTNLVTNPWFAVNTTGWTATNGTIDRTTRYAYQGPAAGLLTASGANATATTAITAAAATHTAQWIVRNLAAASRMVQLKYNGANIGSTVALASGEQKTLTAQFTGTGAPANLELTVTDSANGEQFIIYYAGAEQKAYATSPCPFIDSSGNLLPGYSWSGTAHASTSTRSNAFVLAPNANHLDSSMNGAFSVVMWFTRRVTPDATARVWSANSSANWPFGPSLLVEPDGKVRISPWGTGQGGVPTPSPVPIGEEHCYGMTWDGTTWRAYYDGALIGTSTGRVPSLGLDASMAWQVQGLFRSVLIYRRVLTDAEMAALANLGPRRVDYDTLRMP